MIMNARYVVIGLIAIVLLVGGVVSAKHFFFSKTAISPEESARLLEQDPQHMREEAERMASSQVTTESEPMMTDSTVEEVVVPTKPGRYETYAPEKIRQASKGPVVLFFKASWCPTCKALDADIRKHVDQIPTGTVILEVDYDNSADLKKKYGVTYQHTMVQVDADGKMVAKWSGSPTLKALLPNIKR